MKSSGILITARKGLPALRTPFQRQSRLFSRAVSSSSASETSVSATIITARTHPRPRALLLSTRPLLPAQTRRAYASAPETQSESLKKTALYDLHVAHGAKIVPFGGFHMPVQYKSLSVTASHHFTRSHASLFDVGHMVQHSFEGPGATAFLQRITPAGLESLAANSSTLSALLVPGTGGIVDDTIITKLDNNSFYVVTNAACRDKDLAYLAEQLGQWEKEGRPPLRHEVLDGRGLIALQGPLSEQILEGVLADPKQVDLRGLFFGQSRTVTLKLPDGREVAHVLVSRGGYTGEDGFEISLPEAHTVAATEALLSSAGPDKLQLAGLGARDSLRLEAGMCLYGHDLDEHVTPVEGALGWIVAKERRGETDIAKGAFHGAGVILGQLTPKSKGGAGVEKRRVGLVVEGAPAREGAEIQDAEGARVGVVTSGCPSPTLGKNIAMGYVRDGLHKVDTELQVSVRGRARKAVVTKMPFVPTKYWKGSA
ncbi:glycine cleavage system T protein [Daldinia caldariorum]|uniref:glycine cleavage system T protein n=1 Tax=Daldinia caldariorum TaxID=326644 RepID=UPI0020082F04|nr:glycine cleavage system T protein [Daldinia caldariorum]KAI1466768.1 glycine cleavage system T protein [Daldinia caldariorum]